MFLTLAQCFSRIRVITRFISEEALGFTQRRQWPRGAAEQGRKGQDLADALLRVEAQGELLQLVLVGAGRAGGAPSLCLALGLFGSPSSRGSEPGNMGLSCPLYPSYLLLPAVPLPLLMLQAVKCYLHCWEVLNQLCLIFVIKSNNKEKLVWVNLKGIRYEVLIKE